MVRGFGVAITRSGAKRLHEGGMVSLLHQRAPAEHVDEIRVFHGTSGSYDQRGIRIKLLCLLKWLSRCLLGP